MRAARLGYGITLAAITAVCDGSCTITSSNQSDGPAPTTCTPAPVCNGVTPDPAPAPGATKGPCDFYAEDGGPCVAAHSTVRALFGSYGGPLYQVKKADGTTRDIAPVAPGGIANGADQDAFCGVDACTISIVYDQSGWRNHLTQAPPSMVKPTIANEANAKALPIMLGSQKAYGIRITPGAGYRNNGACGTATCDEPQTAYMVSGADFYNGGCCFDYGNMERNSRNNHEGTMEAVYFGTCIIWGKGAGNGPWVMGDLEDGLWAGDSSPYEPNTPVMMQRFVTGMVKGDSTSAMHPEGHWAIKIGNPQGGTLAKPFDGKRPTPRYNPMRKEGAIGLGTGGDGSAGARGDFYEGVMTRHYSSDAADDAVQANIVSVYGQAL